MSTKDPFNVWLGYNLTKMIIYEQIKVIFGSRAKERLFLAVERFDGQVSGNGDFPCVTVGK